MGPAFLAFAPSPEFIFSLRDTCMRQFPTPYGAQLNFGNEKAAYSAGSYFAMQASCRIVLDHSNLRGVLGQLFNVEHWPCPTMIL
jgi:hypothetical protein